MLHPYAMKYSFTFPVCMIVKREEGGRRVRGEREEREREREERERKQQQQASSKFTAHPVH